MVHGEVSLQHTLQTPLPPHPGWRSGDGRNWSGASPHKPGPAPPVPSAQFPGCHSVLRVDGSAPRRNICGTSLRPYNSGTLATRCLSNNAAVARGRSVLTGQGGLFRAKLGPTYAILQIADRVLAGVKLMMCNTSDSYQGSVTRVMLGLWRHPCSKWRVSCTALAFGSPSQGQLM